LSRWAYYLSANDGTEVRGTIMADITTLAVIFPLSITLHNIEEALWLPKWSQHASRFQKPISKNEFHFAVIVITLLAYLATCFFMYFPEERIFSFVFAGFLGAMIFNAVFPHLAATIALRKYAPGTITGVFLMIPVCILLLNHMVNSGTINVYEIVLSTIGVGIPMVVSIPVLFWAGRILIRYD